MRTISILLSILITGVAWGQELEFRDMAGLGVEANTGACFTPDGKKILLAERGGAGIAYTLIGIDGKDKKQVYEFKLGEQFVNYFARHISNVFPNRHGSISSDGGMFIAMPDLDKDPSKHIVAISGMDGKVSLVSSQPDDPKAAYFINGVFGKDNEVYFFLMDRETVHESNPAFFAAIKVTSGVSGSIMSYDLKTRQRKILAKVDGITVPPIFISPDRSRLAGIASMFTFDNPDKGQCLKFWVYDIPSGQISYSSPITGQEATFGPVIWSKDNSILFVVTSNGFYSFQPFAAPQKAGEEEAKKLKNLAAQLGDEDSGRRESAMAEFRAAGAKALDVLNETAKSTDAEIAARAKKLVAELNAGTVTAILEQKKRQYYIIKNVTEVAPGYLHVYAKESKGDAGTILLVDVATRKIKTLKMDDKILIDKTGDLGLFRDVRDNSLWTAKIEFTPPASQSASGPSVR
ncbi:MAG: hypothetical protein HZA50_05320 [Planctomycetes bacterium]|nr:hypothetical protein [Planctomycetota bacterium]